MNNKKYTTNERLATLEEVFAKLYLAAEGQSKYIKALEERIKTLEDGKKE